MVLLPNSAKQFYSEVETAVLTGRVYIDSQTDYKLVCDNIGLPLMQALDEILYGNVVQHLSIFRLVMDANQAKSKGMKNTTSKAGFYFEIRSKKQMRKVYRDLRKTDLYKKKILVIISPRQTSKLGKEIKSIRTPTSSFEIKLSSIGTYDCVYAHTYEVTQFNTDKNSQDRYLVHNIFMQIDMYLIRRTYFNKVLKQSLKEVFSDIVNSDKYRSELISDYFHQTIMDKDKELRTYNASIWT